MSPISFIRDIKHILYTNMEAWKDGWMIGGGKNNNNNNNNIINRVHIIKFNNNNNNIVYYVLINSIINFKNSSADYSRHSEIQFIREHETCDDVELWRG